MWNCLPNQFDDPRVQKSLAISLDWNSRKNSNADVFRGYVHGELENGGSRLRDV